jgi:RNA polymerase sigma-70 factor (ECF subfamily)
VTDAGGRKAASFLGKGRHPMIDTPDRRILNRLARAIRRLPSDQHAVFCAARYEDLDYAQIAERFGLTIQDVERLFAQAIFAITREMDHPTRRPWWRFC